MNFSDLSKSFLSFLAIDYEGREVIKGKGQHTAESCFWKAIEADLGNSRGWEKS